MVLSYSLKSGKEFVLLYISYWQIASWLLSAFCFPSKKGCTIVMARESRIMLSYQGIDYNRLIQHKFVVCLHKEKEALYRYLQELWSYTYSTAVMPAQSMKCQILAPFVVWVLPLNCRVRFSKLVKSLEQSIRRNKHLQNYSMLCCS